MHGTVKCDSEVRMSKAEKMLKCCVRLHSERQQETLALKHNTFDWPLDFLIFLMYIYGCGAEKNALGYNQETCV